MMFYSFENDHGFFVEGLCTQWLKGSDWNSSQFNSTATTFDAIEELMCHLDELGDGMDLVELCGGESRVSTIAVRRHLQVGENFDLVTNWDLNDPKDQSRVIRYFKKYRPLVAIMGPTCKPFGRLARYNYVHHYDTWKASYEQAAPHGRFCGELALLQDKSKRYFV